MEEKIRHLEMIQEVISRMASNSFTLKGWAVTLVTGIFALSGNVADKVQYLIIFIPIITFWILDAFYLSRERSYRELYKHVSGLNKDEIDFNMDFTPFICKKNKCSSRNLLCKFTCGKESYQFRYTFLYYPDVCANIIYIR